ncbi:MAG: OmpA family protein [Desulfatitalea sp.]
MKLGLMRGLVAVLIAGALLLGVGGLAVAADKVAINQGEPLVVHFDKGKTTLGDADRATIRRLLNSAGLSAENKFLVVGYTDNGGDSKKNTRLSFQRAQAVRREIISGLKVAEQNVLAMGRGAENPVGDNLQPQGRARNRRVEIFWVQGVDRQLKGKSERPAPDKASLEAMVQDARTMIRRRQLAEALRLLRKARAQGGDGESSWQSAYGIAGFYAGIGAEKVKSHLSMALSLDPFNQEARDYLGRIKAREKVADGQVTARMGRSEQEAIPVTCDAQAYEYLCLFAVKPLSKEKWVTRPMEVWHCRDARGRPVVYFFDRSQMYAWAFAQNESDSAFQGGIQHSNPGPTVAPDGEANAKDKDSPSAPVSVWESKLFR